MVTRIGTRWEDLGKVGSPFVGFELQDQKGPWERLWSGTGPGQNWAHYLLSSNSSSKLLSLSSRVEGGDWGDKVSDIFLCRISRRLTIMNAYHPAFYNRVPFFHLPARSIRTRQETLNEGLGNCELAEICWRLSYIRRGICIWHHTEGTLWKVWTEIVEAALMRLAFFGLILIWTSWPQGQNTDIDM
jgi:hypothetical protein